MDPKRKKLYIIVIILCIGLSVGILVWGGIFSSPDAQENPHQIADTTVGIGIDQTQQFFSPDMGFPAPRVFPNKNTFDTDVLNSNAYKRLRPYQAVDATGKLGRPDPFRSY